MELSKRSKIALGIATLLEVAFPLLIALLYMLVFFLLPIMMAFNPKSEGAVIVFFFIGMMVFFFCYDVLFDLSDHNEGLISNYCYPE